MIRFSRLQVFIFFLIISWCSNATALSYKVIKKHQHSTKASTQGLVIEDGYLYESSGGYGNSYLTKYNLRTGKVIKTYQLPRRYFGEGIAILGNKIYWLTYRAGICFVLNKKTFKLIKSMTFQGEGWGLSTNGKSLLMSNGSANIFYRDANDFHIIRSIVVKKRKKKITNLNEIEYASGMIYANIWNKNKIAIINPRDGVLIGWLNLRKLNPNPKTYKGENVLNGIAYNKKTKLFFVTGKNWPVMYAIRVRFDNSASIRYHAREGQHPD